MRSIRIAVKYLVIGLAAGLLIAPRSGRETRDHLLHHIAAMVEQLAGVEPSQPPPTARL